MSSFFITATDTDAGKTYISSMLLHAAGFNNQKSLGFKPIASGIEIFNGKQINQDIELLKAASTVSIPDSAMNCYLFEPAIAPHIAAAKEAKDIDLELIIQQVNNYQNQADFVLVEGVGGWEVPLNNHQGIPDLAKMLSFPIIVVVKIKTGCINHAILTINAISQCGLEIAGWVANQIIDDEISKENIRAIENRSGLFCLAVINESNLSTYSQQIDFFKQNNKPDTEIMDLYYKLSKSNSL
jgi:dethiobiotin synthetase